MNVGRSHHATKIWTSRLYTDCDKKHCKIVLRPQEQGNFYSSHEPV